MLSKRDEILIQRSVDGELSTDERRELLQRMEEVPAGWKELACAFMEDQLFGSAVLADTGTSVQAEAATRSGSSPSPSLSRASSRRWYNHPLTTVALTVCVAFLAGMLVSGEMHGGAGQLTVASNPDTLMNDSATPSDVATMAVQDAPAAPTSGSLVSTGGSGYHARIELDGMAPREVPIYDDPAEFIQELKRRGEADADSQSRIHFIRINTDDGKTFVLPFQGSIPRFQ